MIVNHETTQGIETGQVIWLDRISSPHPHPPIGDFLRHGTRTSRRRRDDLFSTLDLSTDRRYAGFLCAEAEALFPLEAALEHKNIVALLPDWRHRARSLSLSRDLLALGAACDPLPMPDLAEPTDMLGVCYALEASRMSARILLARLASGIAERPAHAALAATSYLRHGFGERVWPSFTAFLDAHPMARAQPVRVLRAAQMAFGMFEGAHGAAARVSRSVVD